MEFNYPNPIIKHYLVNGIPKSGTLFLARSVSMNLNLNPKFEYRIGSRGFESQVQADRLEELLAGPPKVLQEHLAPTSYNLALLKALGLNRFVLILRDPRDIICSLRHHLLRADARTAWHIAMVQASGIITKSFYSCTPEGQMDILIEHAFPKLQEWTASWLPWLEDSDLDIHLVRYEDFTLDNIAVVRGVLKFFDAGLESEILLPSIDRSVAGIDLSTHFRRGISGSFRDELTQTQIQKLEKCIDSKLFEQLGWKI